MPNDKIHLEGYHQMKVNDEIITVYVLEKGEYPCEIIDEKQQVTGVCCYSLHYNEDGSDSEPYACYGHVFASDGWLEQHPHLNEYSVSGQFMLIE